MKRLTREERSAFWRSFAIWCAISAVLAAAATAVVVLAVIRGQPRVDTAGLALPPPVDASTHARLVQQLEIIDAAVDVFQTRHGRLPAHLDEIVRDGLLPHRALVASGTSATFFYAVTPDGHVLAPPLPAARSGAETRRAAAELDALPSD